MVASCSQNAAMRPRYAIGITPPSTLTSRRRDRGLPGWRGRLARSSREPGEQAAELRDLGGGERTGQMTSHGLGKNWLRPAEDLRAGWRQRRVHGAPVACVTVPGHPAPFLESVDGLGHRAARPARSRARAPPSGTIQSGSLDALTSSRKRSLIIFKCPSGLVPPQCLPASVNRWRAGLSSIARRS